MSKVKSAIITAIVVIAIVVAAVFGVASLNVSATQRYNSIAASIPLGSDYTGYVFTTIYPEGVITQSEFNALSDEDKASYVAEGDLYFSEEESGNKTLEEIKEAVSADAAIISQRLSERGLTDYYVSVRDGISIVAGVPSGYTYAAYKGDSSTDRSNALTLSANTLGYLLADGELTLRTSDASITLGDDDTSATVDMTQNADEYTDADILGDGSATYPFIGPTEDFTQYFSSVTSYTFGGTHVLSFSLTEEGREKMREISSTAAYSDSQAIYMCIGDTQVLSITSSSTIDSDTMQFSMSDASVAGDTATVLNSVVSGGTLSADYRSIDTVLSSTAAGGENAALLAFIGCVVVLAALCVAAIIKYKKLGGVLSLSFIILALVMLYALYILSVQVTLEVLITCLGVLVLFAATNLFVLNEVRAQCKTGKTMQAAIKAAYKRTLMGIIDIHVIILVAAILLASVAVGAAAACGLILVVGTIASYVLYWFTRFMWHTCSAPQRNKFAFGGFKREVYGDDE